ncbi:MAG TPA: hypothetical protein VMP01_15165 [Pirellulaceae bacterium]|nr:hypothetical protein [Pirellulaceae bacterium]
MPAGRFNHLDAKVAGKVALSFGTWTCLAAAFLSLPSALVPLSAAEGEIDLTPRAVAGRVQQVHTVVEVQGKLAINPDGKSVRRLPMEAKADLRFTEKFLPPSRESAEVRTIRHYTAADARIRIQESHIEQTLRPERRLIASRIADTAHLVSLSGPLTREELELIDTVGNSALLDMLLPRKSVALGGKWNLTDSAVARLLSLEAVGQQDVVATLKKVEDGLAIIDLAGKVSGAVGGVSTELTLEGKANFHLERKCVTWLALQYDEKRAIGHAQPGYDATIRVRVQAEPIQSSPELSDPSLPSLVAKDQVGQSLLEFKAEKAGIAFLHDRRWNVMVDRFDTVILRLIDRGDLIAQCNITRLPALEKGKQMALAEFQRDVEQTLSKNMAQIVEATQSQNDEGLRVLRIVVSGTASELPIQWVYYHLSDASGQRASLVFTMEAKLVDRFAQIDRELVENVELSPSLLDETKEPTPAAAAGKSARKPASDPTRAK